MGGRQTCPRPLSIGGTTSWPGLKCVACRHGLWSAQLANRDAAVGCHMEVDDGTGQAA